MELLSGALVVPALGLYLVGGPTVDVLHGRVEHGVGMFLARVGLPAAGALLGGLIGFAQYGNNARENGTLYDTLGGAGIGAGVGMFAAILWDNLTAFEPVSTAPARVSLIPMATARTGALALSVRF